MDSHEEDGEIREEGRHGHLDDRDDDDFSSVSSYDGDQGDSLVIKPPQAIAHRRDKREKREKRERHRHKGERHKERHRNREHRAHEEGRHREHRRRREHDEDRREMRKHIKNRERAGKHERLGQEIRVKPEKERKLMEREQERRREREREDYYDERELLYERQREHAGGGRPLVQHLMAGPYREKRGEDRATYASGPLSPRERTEKERRMERFLAAGFHKVRRVDDVSVSRESRAAASQSPEKQRELSQREADFRRQRKEEEKREELRQRVELEELRQRAEASMMRHTRPHTPEAAKAHKKSKTHQFDAADDVVELISDTEDVKEELGEQEASDHSKEDPKEDEKRKVKADSDKDDEEKESVESGSSESEEDSDSDSSSSESDEDDDDDDDEERKERKSDKDEDHKERFRARTRSRSPSVSSTEKEDSSRTGSRGHSPDNSPPAHSPIVVVKPALPNYYPAIMGCRSVDEFECLNRIEEGTYGVVYRAREKATNEIVALKRLKMEKEKEGFPITSLREVNTLLKSQHENIVTVREIVVGSNMDKIYIVMDYVEHDLKSLMETMKLKRQMFTIGEIKTLLIQLLRAVHHLHDNWILHRDLKTSNLLLSHRGILKVGDFGLAREYGSPLKQYTPIVVTLWYRAPELLLGCKDYSTPIDVWSVGCIFGELLSMEPMFPGKSEIDQLNKIFKDLGTPSEKIWPGYSQLPVVKKTQFADYPYNHLRERFKTRLSEQGFELMNRFLTYNPHKRITCQEAIRHPYFHLEAPPPTDPAMFPTWPAKSENPHFSRIKKTGLSPKPPSGGKDFKELGDGEDETIAGFFLGGSVASGPGFTLKF